VSTIAGARRAADLYRESGGHALRREGVESLGTIRQLGLPDELVDALIAASGGARGYAKSVTEHELNSFTSVIDSASLIAAHSLIDDAMLQYCRVTAAVDPSAWESVVLGKRIDLSQVKGRTFEEIRDDLVSAHVESLDRASLLTKYDALMRVIRPTGTETEYLDRDRLLKIDELRHALVHGEGLTAVPTFDSDFHFLQAVMFRCWYLTWKRYPQCYPDLGSAPSRPGA
jgi:hypothetical protein